MASSRDCSKRVDVHGARWDSPQGAESGSELQLGRMSDLGKSQGSGTGTVFEKENMVQSALSQVSGKCRKHKLFSPIPKM